MVRIIEIYEHLLDIRKSQSSW